MGCSTFWSQFWPALAATVVGAGIGVPVGLAIDRWRQTLAARTERRKVAHLLLDSVRWNRAALQGLRSRWDDSMYGQLGGTGLDLGAWEALRTDALRFIDDRALRVQVTQFYGRLATLEQETFEVNGRAFEHAIRMGGGQNAWITQARGRALGMIAAAIAEAEPLEASLATAAGEPQP